VFASVEEALDEQIERVIDANLLGSIHVIRAALPQLRARKATVAFCRSRRRAARRHTRTSPTATRPSVGHRGFCETIAQEVAPLGIGVTIVEPSATPTGFSGALDTSPAMGAYDATPAGGWRAAASGVFPVDNDAEKIAAAMIASAQTSPAPLRPPLGRACARRASGGWRSSTRAVTPPRSCVAAPRPPDGLTLIERDQLERENLDDRERAASQADDCLQRAGGWRLLTISLPISQRRRSRPASSASRSPARS
jgi:hypothetical protein